MTLLILSALCVAGWFFALCFWGETHTSRNVVRLLTEEVKNLDAQVVALAASYRPPFSYSGATLAELVKEAEL